MQELRHQNLKQMLETQESLSEKHKLFRVEACRALMTAGVPLNALAIKRPDGKEVPSPLRLIIEKGCESLGGPNVMADYIPTVRQMELDMLDLELEAARKEDSEGILHYR